VTAPEATLSTGDVLPIGELAQRTGVTTRTLRYWEELGLIRPSGHRGGGERLYLPADMARVTRIRDLQELLGFSLAEVRVVLETPDADALDRVRSEYRWGDAGPARRRALLIEAAEANDRLLARLDDTLARLRTFRDEQAAKARRLAGLLADLDGAAGATDERGTEEDAR
jgi:MerR family transcriptional regulator, repressor of the yfmOP operon